MEQGEGIIPRYLIWVRVRPNADRFLLGRIIEEGFKHDFCTTFGREQSMDAVARELSFRQIVGVYQVIRDDHECAKYGNVTQQVVGEMLVKLHEKLSQ